MRKSLNKVFTSIVFVVLWGCAYSLGILKTEVKV